MLSPQAASFTLCVAVAAFLLVLPRPRRPAEEESHPDAYGLQVIELEVEQGGRRRSVRVPRTALIGRGEHADLVINDPQVSRLHARLEIRDGIVLAEDLGSRNGTGRNGQKLNGVIPLDPGDRLRVGTATITFRGVGTWT